MEPDLRCPEQRIRLLDDDDKLEALIGLLTRERVPLTSFTVMKHAARYADRLNALAQKANVEFAVHSYSHNQAKPASKDEVKLSWDAFCNLWNNPPQGYRSPNCLIDSSGLRNLAAQGFVYDSSITPSIRFDSYSYNHMNLPRDPFIFGDLERKLLELPIFCLVGVPLPFVFSFIKLFGLLPYRAAMQVQSLPDYLVTYFHPYDLYTYEIAANIPGWKRYAHLRNSRRALPLLEAVITMLKGLGYEFMTMRDVAQRVLAAGKLPAIASTDAD
jgi:peptidoglycan/xylan/chitin deacetylase (PgdA/CDA1 family)